MRGTAVLSSRERLLRPPVAEPEIVDVPEIGFVMVDGTGDPNCAPEYRDAIQALYSVSYTLRFSLKRAGVSDERVAPLEGLWWAEDMSSFRAGRKGTWRWTAMIAQPDAVIPERFEAAREDVARRHDLPALERCRLERFAEGRCAQIMHVGPYAAEGPTIERLHRFIEDHGYRFDGRVQKHHEIYLGDPRRTAPERLRTIIRQPFTER